MQSGVLATLTEVQITHPSTYNSGTNYTDKMTNDSIKNDMITENMKPEVGDSNPDITKLKNYINPQKTIVFRVHPLVLPQNINKSDHIAYQPFNVFIFKKDLPSFVNTNNFKDIVVCNIHKIEPPIDLREGKEERPTKSDVVVRVCIIDEYFKFFSKELKPCFSERIVCRKYPVLFMSEKIMSTFNILVGAKVSLGNSFQFQPNILSLEIVSTNKKIKNVTELFRNYITNQAKHGKCLLNSNFCIEIQSNVFCSLTFNPDSEFCLFDEQMARGMKMYENEDKKVVHEKSEISRSFINTKELFNDCDSFNKILNRATKILSLRNSSENVFIVGKYMYF